METLFALIFSFACFFGLLSVWQAIPVLADNMFLQIMCSILALLIAWVLFKRLWRFFAALLSRIAFCRALRRLARKERLDIKQHHAVWASFFRSYAGADITLRSRKEELNIKFLPYQGYKRILHIENERRMILSRPWAFLHMGMGVRGRTVVTTPVTAELFPRYKSVSLGFGESRGRCVYIIPPKCFRMTCLTENGRRMEYIDNGYVYENGAVFYEQRVLLSHVYTFLIGEEKPDEKGRHIS